MGCSCIKGSSTVEGVDQPRGKSSAPSSDVINKKVQQAVKTRVLALRECGLKTLPKGATAQDAASLRTVDLSGNLLKALPDSIAVWSDLQNLLCEQNALSELPVAIGQLVSLQKLVLTGNQLRALPVELGLLGKVKILQLSNNKIGPQLPAELFNDNGLGQSLEELDLSGNSLEEFPSSVDKLKTLVRLNVARNKLASLPAEIGALPKIQSVDAAENVLTAILPSVIAAPNLSELWLKGNPIDRLQLQEMTGFADFLERRKQRLDAKISANVVGAVDLSVCGLD
eukprot:TRINITY_DN69605_c0_g1_i1.p1 TRINITY_DN69605_c0_g1~~TRINITY_DN69605_c0_g1_i1.p1  ORF type:complete len:284 (+),score=66.23 TRINITY_DN69605_c0_g1_i1:78-929(+)